jgi:hypothetical protein
MGAAFAWAMAGAASAHQAATATHADTSQQRAGRTRRTRADPQRAQKGATTAAAAASAALNRLSRLQQLADASPQVAQLRRLQALVDGQLAPVAQLAGGTKKEERVQDKFANVELQPQLLQAPRVNNTGLPDSLKAGIESLSGMSLDHVRVHYNSAQPAQINAFAYAQGSDIHVAPGQEPYLPHEAWHLVQQAQGKVKQTKRLKDGMPVNDDAGLEREAEVMGAKALASADQLACRSDGEELLQCKSAPSQRRQSGSNYFKRETGGLIVLRTGFEKIQTSPDAESVVQCAGLVLFGNLSPVSVEFGEKAARLITILQDSDWIKLHLGRRDAKITLVQQKQPATVTDDGEEDVQITLSTWFFENKSVGRIVGMLAHEFGVHPIGDAYVKFRGEPNVVEARPQEFQTGRVNDVVNTERAGQADHIFAAIQGQPRYDAYRETLASLLISMYQQDSEGNISDTIMTYLADVAMILATNDWRPGILFQPSKVAEYFNLERHRWIAWLEKQEAEATPEEGVMLEKFIEQTPREQHSLDVIREAMHIIYFLAYDYFFGGASLAQ